MSSDTPANTVIDTSEVVDDNASDTSPLISTNDAPVTTTTVTTLPSSSASTVIFPPSPESVANPRSETNIPSLPSKSSNESNDEELSSLPPLPTSTSTFSLNKCTKSRIFFLLTGISVVIYLIYGEYHPVPGRSWFIDNNPFRSQAATIPPKRKSAFLAYDHNKLFNASFLYTEEGMDFDSWKHYPKEHLAPLTAEAQTYIFNHQHPISCENKRFLISHGNDDTAGLGSTLHISGMHLALAIELDRIFIWSPDVARAYTDDVTCGGNQNLECFFRSPTNCTLGDAYKEGSNTINARFGQAAADNHLSYWFTPSIFRKMWENLQIPIGEHEMKYWWRGQSVAYLARFRPESIALLKSLRTEPEKVLGFSANTQQDTWLNRLNSSFPFPQGTMNLHVRHGDKGIEMQLVEDQKYFVAAENLVVQAPMGYHRAAFLSTEDPSTIEYAKSSGNAELVNKGWRYVWYDVPRINSNGIDQLNKISTIKRGVLTHIWWLQLMMALECDAWVGTRASNWNRLIDELRCIWVPKCQNEYVEVGNPGDYKNYHWLV